MKANRESEMYTVHSKSRGIVYYTLYKNVTTVSPSSIYMMIVPRELYSRIKPGDTVLYQSNTDTEYQHAMYTFISNDNVICKVRYSIPHDPTKDTEITLRV